MQRFDRSKLPGADPASRDRNTRSGEADAVTEWQSLEGPANALDLERLEEQAHNYFEDLGVTSEVGHQFFKHIPPRLTTIRLQLCTLARTQGASKRRSCLTGLSMQCQWLAGYARMGGFHGLSQVATALEALLKALSTAPERIDDAVLRTTAQAADLLNALASTPPAKAGRAEGARVLVVDDDGRSRTSVLAALESFSIAGVGVSVDAALGLLAENALDLIVLRTDGDARTGPQLCQAIRRLRQHSATPIMVLSPKADWESRAVLAMSGATEVVQGRALRPELALKALAHFFRGRLGANCSRARPAWINSAD